MTLYRLATKTDAQELADLRWRLHTEDEPLLDAAAKADFVRDFVERLGAAPDPDLVHWVAQADDGALAGVMSVRTIRKLPLPDDLDGRFGIITNSYVRPAFRGGGVGTALLATVKEWAIAQRFELLVVWPSELSYAFYERAGYRRYPDPVVLKLA